MIIQKYIYRTWINQVFYLYKMEITDQKSRCMGKADVRRFCGIIETLENENRRRKRPETTETIEAYKKLLTEHLENEEGFLPKFITIMNKYNAFLDKCKSERLLRMQRLTFNQEKSKRLES